MTEEGTDYRWEKKMMENTLTNRDKEIGGNVILVEGEGENRVSSSYSNRG